MAKQNKNKAENRKLFEKVKKLSEKMTLSAACKQVGLNVSTFYLHRNELDNRVVTHNLTTKTVSRIKRKKIDKKVMLVIGEAEAINEIIRTL